RGERVAALDGAVLRCIPNLQRRHDFAASEALDLEFPVRYLPCALAHSLDYLPCALAHSLDTAVKRIETLWPTRRQRPTHRGSGLRDRRPCDRGRRDAGACSHEKRTPLHLWSPAER